LLRRWWCYFTLDDALAHKLRGIVNHCMYELPPWCSGCKLKIDSIQAAVLNAITFVRSIRKARQDAARKYSAALKGHKKYNCTEHLWYLRLSRISSVYFKNLDADRNGLMQHLLDKGIFIILFRRSFKSILGFQIQKKRIFR
jgi:dTDP-4-amino-4,6-dideoxygalactose transaminase